MPSDDWEGFSVDNQINFFWLNNKKKLYLNTNFGKIKWLPTDSNKKID